MREDEPHSEEGEYMQSPKGFVEGRVEPVLTAQWTWTRTCLPAGWLLLPCCWLSRLDGPQLPCSLSSSLQRANIPRSPIDACPLSIIISFLPLSLVAKWEYDKKTRQVVLHSSAAVVMLCCSNEITKQKLSNYKKAVVAANAAAAINRRQKPNCNRPRWQPPRRPSPRRPTTTDDDRLLIDI